MTGYPTPSSTPKLPNSNKGTAIRSVPSKLTGLLAWFEKEGIEYNAELISIEYSLNVDDSLSFHVNSKNSIEEGSIVAKIPKISVLSIKNCGIADIIGNNSQFEFVFLTLFHDRGK